MITGTRASTWLDPMRAALDSSDHRSPIFFRDDDAGWDDAGCRRSCTCSTGTACRSTWPSSRLRCPSPWPPTSEPGPRTGPHGYAHLNHEPAGRKHEFGPSRKASAQQSDIARGRSLLREAFDAALDPVFTPPWNRCTRGTADTLVALGFEVLSRDHTATGFDRPDLHEVPVTVDWFGHRSGVRWTRGELARRLAEGVANGGAVGVMLHHAISDVEDRAAIRDLLRLVAGHEQARATTILRLSRGTRPASVRGGVPASPEADRDL